MRAIAFQFRFLTSVLLCLCCTTFFSLVSANSTEQGSMQVMSEFSNMGAEKHQHLTDDEKKEFMFYMGAPLLLMLLITVILGVAMAIYGKQVFVAHMVFAGLSLTLACAHAVAGVVWFYPF